MNKLDASQQTPLSQRAAINTIEAATYLGVSYSWLTKLRVFGGGRAFLKLGRRVVYRQVDLDKWLLDHRRQSTTENGRPTYAY